VPTGTIKSVELEREHGALIYSHDLIVPGRKGVEEVNVDAMTGKVISQEHESLAAERKETTREPLNQTLDGSFRTVRVVATAGRSDHLDVHTRAGYLASAR
jgi:hypothetical protein